VKESKMQEINGFFYLIAGERSHIVCHINTANCRKQFVKQNPEIFGYLFLKQNHVPSPLKVES
jgi:hypothetical protein